MRNQQKALIVKTGPDSVHGLDELNLNLHRGWRVQHVAPMGAAGVGAQDGTPALQFAALVIIERDEERAAALIEEAEEDVEEIIEEMAEGDGATVEVDDDDLTPDEPTAAW